MPPSKARGSIHKNHQRAGLVVVNVLPIAQCHFDKGQAKDFRLRKQKVFLTRFGCGWVGRGRGRTNEAGRHGMDGGQRRETSKLHTFIVPAPSSLGIGCWCGGGCRASWRRAWHGSETGWVVIGRPWGGRFLDVLAMAGRAGGCRP